MATTKPDCSSRVALEYRATSSTEPHRVRRAAILRDHPEIADLFGFDPLPKYYMGAAIVLQLVLAAAISELSKIASTGWTVVALVVMAYGIGAFANHYGGVIMHECFHGSCARTPNGNRWVAIFANLAIVLPYAMSFRRDHLAHHSFLGVEAKDNDLPPEFERALIGNSAARKLLWIFFYPVFAVLFRRFIRRPDRWEIVNWIVVLAANGVILAWLGPWALAYLAVSTWFSASLHPIAGHFIHEHYIWNENQETYSYYGPLNHITCNMGYHVEHHDFPGIPGKYLPQLRAMAREWYEPLQSHDSWAGVFVRFVIDPSLSHYNRFVRDGKDGSRAVTLPDQPGVTPAAMAAFAEDAHEPEPPREHPVSEARIPRLAETASALPQS